MSSWRGAGWWPPPGGWRRAAGARAWRSGSGGRGSWSISSLASIVPLPGSDQANDAPWTFVLGGAVAGVSAQHAALDPGDRGGAVAEAGAALGQNGDREVAVIPSQQPALVHAPAAASRVPAALEVDRPPPRARVGEPPALADDDAPAQPERVRAMALGEPA